MPAVLLILAMLLSLTGIASAATPTTYSEASVFSDIEGNRFRDAFAFLAGLGVYQGDEGLGKAARPEDPIKRSEFTAVVTRMLGAEAIAQANEEQRPEFGDDVPIWAWGYVNYAVSKGIIKGYEDGTFRAANNVTHAEALAMLLRALGLDEAAEGTWPMNYLILAYDVRLDAGVTPSANTPCTRGEIAKLVYNAMVEVDHRWDAATGLVRDTARGPLVERLDAYKVVRGVVTGVSVADWQLVVDGSTYEICDPVTLLGADSLGVLKNSEVVLYLTEVDDEWLVRSIDVLKEAGFVSGKFYRLATRDSGLDGEKRYIEMADGTLVEYDPSSINIEVNGDEGAYTSMGTLESDFGVSHPNDAYLEMEITLSKKGGDLRASRVKATFWNVTDGLLGSPKDAITYKDQDLGQLVDQVTLDTGYVWTAGFSEGYYTDSGVDFTVDKNTTIKVNGTTASLDSLRENDVVKVAKSGDVAYKLYVNRETISGEVVSVRIVDEVTTVKLKKANGSQVDVELDAYVDDPALEAEVTYGLNEDGVAIVEIAKISRVPYVLVKSTSRVTGSTVKEYVTVDSRGQTVTYEVIGGFDDIIKDSVIEIEFDRTRVIFAQTLYDPGDPLQNIRNDMDALDWGKVISAGNDSVAIEPEAGGLVTTAEDFTVYAEDTEVDSEGIRYGNGEVGDYIGGNGLKANDYVWYVSTADGVAFIFKPYKNPPIPWPE